MYSPTDLCVCMCVPVSLGTCLAAKRTKTFNTAAFLPSEGLP